MELYRLSTAELNSAAFRKKNYDQDYFTPFIDFAVLNLYKSESTRPSSFFSFNLYESPSIYLICNTILILNSLLSRNLLESITILFEFNWWLYL